MILYNKFNLLVINKSYGTLCCGKKSFIKDCILLYKPINRLDLNTSGIVLFSNKNYIIKKIQLFLLKKKITKIYISIYYKKIILRLRLVSWIYFKFVWKCCISYLWYYIKNDKFVLLKLKLITGRKYQLRRHLNNKISLFDWILHSRFIYLSIKNKNLYVSSYLI